VKAASSACSNSQLSHNIDELVVMSLQPSHGHRLGMVSPPFGWSDTLI
jgi:hypothetical protein